MLTIELQAGGRRVQRRAHEVLFRRGMMAPATVRVVAPATADDAALLLGGASLRSFLDDGASSSLHAAARITAARWFDDRREHLILEATTTSAHTDGARPASAAREPRRRVLRAANVSEMFGFLDHVARLSTGLRNHLATLTLRDPNAKAFIQDGISDVALLHALVAQLPLLEPDPRWTRLALIGGVDPNARTGGRWLLEFADKRAHEALGAVDGKNVGSPDGRGTRVEFGTVRGGSSTVDSDGGVPTVRETWVSRPLSPDLWQAWTTRDLPLFRGEAGHLVMSVEDRLTDGGGGEVSWSSTLEFLPAATFVCMPTPAAAWSPFHCDVATVLKAAPDGHQVTVRLAGFEHEDGGDEVEALLDSPYTGPDGRGGLHLVPHAGTTVRIAWSGRLGEPLVAGAGVRREPPRLAAPSLELTETARVRLRDLDMPSIGALAIGSDLQAKVEGVFGMAAGGATAALRDGAFHTAGG